MAGAELRVLVPADGGPLEKAARTVLVAVPDTIWSRSEDGTLLQARFSADIGDGLNNLLRRLAAAGGVARRRRFAPAWWPAAAGAREARRTAPAQLARSRLHRRGSNSIQTHRADAVQSQVSAPRLPAAPQRLRSADGTFVSPA
ncbi:Protein of unknown function [Gryllus bimaculatus]|nr:Protein of unknown function [Gryllus bimaculatus]